MLGLTILSPSEQVAVHLRGELMRGRWAETMPGGPTLAAELGIDKKTVEAALGLLEEERLLIPQGAGRPRRIELPADHAPPQLRVARMARRTEADAWVVTSASREVLEWFAEQETPAFALAGRYGGLPLAGTKPDKSSTITAVVHRLVALGHRRISLLCRRHLRLPQPARATRSARCPTRGCT